MPSDTPRDKFIRAARYLQTCKQQYLAAALAAKEAKAAYEQAERDAATAELRCDRARDIVNASIDAALGVRDVRT